MPASHCRRETLAGLLWPEETDRVALQNLRQVLYRLRQAIAGAHCDPPLILATRHALQFVAGDDCWADAIRFGEAEVAVRGHAHRGVESCSSCVARLREATGLYRGELMAGFSFPSAPFEHWLVMERERLHRQALEVLQRLSVHWEQCGEYEQALQHARRQVELEPWDEVAQQAVMRLLALSGQRSAALAQYEVCARALAEELGVQPSAETTHLYEQIRDEEDL